MMSREYRCADCGYEWSEISEYKALDCPECQSDIVDVTWQARAYD